LRNFEARAVFVVTSPFSDASSQPWEVFDCCIILPIQGKASLMIRGAGRLRKQSM
jgi:hypothetical protein